MTHARLFTAIATALTSVVAMAAAGSLELKRSDVVLMGGSSNAVYSAYGATVVDWGGHAWKDDTHAISFFRARVRAAQNLGIKYNAGIGMLTEFAGMIKSCPDHERAVCRNFDGQPIMVPWLWDQKVDGQTGKNFWFCSNSPFYQEYLRDLTALAMAGEPDGYHIDDFGGSNGTVWMGGCFCESCMRLFTEHLKRNGPAGKLREWNVDALDGFHYGRFLRTQGLKGNDDYLKRRGSLPLDAEFRLFQAKSAGEVVRGLQEHASRLRGRPLARSVNGSPPSHQAFVVRPHVDHYSCEIGMGAPGSEWSGVAKKKLTTSAAFVYRCADMAERGIAGTADGHSWAFVNERGSVNLCRYWIAEAYAFGHCFMAPSTHQWCYTKEKGTHWHRARPEDYADLYQFIRQNASLFDGCEPVAQAAVVFDHKAWRNGKKDAQAAATALLEANVPSAFVAAGDELLDLRLSTRALAKFEKIVVPTGLMLDPEQEAVLQKLSPARKVVWKDPAALQAALVPWLAVEGAKDVWALPRRKPGSAALTIHLLNRNYDFEKEQIAPQRSFALCIRRSLLGGQPPPECKAFSPDAGPATLPVETSGDGVRIAIPELRLWSVLQIEI